MHNPHRSKALELAEVCMFFSDMEGIRVANVPPLGTKQRERQTADEIGEDQCC